MTLPNLLMVLFLAFGVISLVLIFADSTEFVQRILGNSNTVHRVDSETDDLLIQMPDYRHQTLLLLAIGFLVSVAIAIAVSILGKGNSGITVSRIALFAGLMVTSISMIIVGNFFSSKAARQALEELSYELRMETDQSNSESSVDKVKNQNFEQYADSFFAKVNSDSRPQYAPEITPIYTKRAYFNTHELVSGD